jgi:hypothetical protein
MMYRLENFLWLLFGGGMIAAVALAVQELPTANPWKGILPHNVPHCSPAPHDINKTAPCACIGMVTRLRSNYTDRCFGELDMTEQGYAAFKLGIMLGIELPAPLQECLAQQPDHCEVLTNTGRLMWETGTKWDGKQTCSTACKPERCGCADNPCKAHKVEG